MTNPRVGEAAPPAEDRQGGYLVHLGVWTDD